MYRQAVSRLLRQLRLPYRFDMEFRSNLEQGTTAVAFTTAGPSMMPESRYDERAHDWVSFSQGERAAMSAAYNLRVGLIIAALCFGASERVDQVCVRIDSIGLEEAVAEQDSAISDLMSAALRSFERLHTAMPARPRPIRRTATITAILRIRLPRSRRLMPAPRRRMPEAPRTRRRIPPVSPFLRPSGMMICSRWRASPT